MCSFQAILMRRGSEKEEPAGLYALRTPYQAGDQACTVAFEDRGDANNFCYLLESYFEDLGDFSADIVPLSIQVSAKGISSTLFDNFLSLNDTFHTNFLVGYEGISGCMLVL